MDVDTKQAKRQKPWRFDQSYLCEGGGKGNKEAPMVTSIQKKAIKLQAQGADAEKGSHQTAAHDIWNCVLDQ